MSAPASSCSRGCASSRAAGTFASGRSGGRRSTRPSCSVSCASARTTGCCCRAAACSGRSSSATARSCRATPRPGPRGTIPRRSRRDGSCRGSGSPRRPISRCATSRCCSPHAGSPRADASQAAAVATILRGYARYPQLLRVLDRLGVDDVARLAALVHRADGLAQAAADWRGHAAMVRWQSALVFLDHMTRLGAVDRDELHRALDALAAPEPASASRGTRVRALLAGLGVGAVAGDPPSRAVEDALVARLTRSRLGAGRRVTWEGQAYRIDVGAAERDRIARVRGRDAQARLDAAWSTFALSDLRGVPDAPDAIARIARVVAIARLDRTPGIDERLGVEARTAAATARRLLERGTVDRDWPEIRRSLDDLGDALATEALAEMAYAVSLGWAEDLPLTALAAFRRHVFTRPSPTGMLDASWLAPDIVTARGERLARGRQPARARRRAGAGGAAAAVAEAARRRAEPQHGRSALARHHRRRARSRPLHRRRAAAAGGGGRARRGPRARQPRRRRGAPGGRGRRRDAAPSDAGGVDRRGESVCPGRRIVADRDRAAGLGRRRAAGDPWTAGGRRSGPSPDASPAVRCHRGRGNAMPGDPSGWYRAPCRTCS